MGMAEFMESRAHRRSTRDRMIIAAAKLLQRQGYQGTGLNQILAEADAPKGSMYFHFPGGKEELTAVAIASAADYIDAALVTHEAATAREALDSYIDAAAGHLERSGFTAGCPISTVALEAAPISEPIGEATAAALEKVVARLRSWLERDGLSPDDAAERAALIYAALAGTFVFAKAQRSRRPLDRLRENIGRFLD